MATDNSSSVVKMQAVAGKSIEMPSGQFVANAAYTREGADLHLKSPDGHEIVVKDYFTLNPPPALVTHDGAHMSPGLVDSFLPPQHAGQYAAADTGSLSDVSPDGRITEVVGGATVTHADGTKVTATSGMAVSAGDVIETAKDGAVNIQFADNTTFAISENGRLAVNEYAYNASEHSGHTFFSILQGIFVYTSGMIGHNNHNNVHIETPVGSIGVRGTIVAGEIHPAGQQSKITIVQGAIVVTNAGGSIELGNNLHTAAFSSYQAAPHDMGVIDTHTFANYYSAIQSVTPDTFTHVNDGSYAAHDAALRAAAEKAAATPGHDDAAHPANGADAPAHDVAPHNDGQHTDNQTMVAPPATALPATIAVPVAPASDSSFANAAGSTFTAPADGGGTTTTAATSGVTSAVTSAIVSTVGGTTTTSVTHTGSTTTTAAGTTGTTTTTTPPPAPVLHFAFGTEYTKGTATLSDDGIPAFDRAGLGAPVEIGHAVLTNFSAPVHYELTYSDSLNTAARYTTSGTIDAGTYQVTSGYNTAIGHDQLFNFDSTTGAITLNDVGLHLIAGTPSFTLTAKDASGNIVASTSFVFNAGDHTGNVFLGTTGNDSTNTAGTLGTGGIDLTAPNSTIFMFDGNDRVNIIGSQGNHIDMGLGNDLVILNSFLPDNVIDGGVGNDRIVFNAPATAFDFTTPGNAPVLKNIETIDLGGGTVTASVKLGIADIFDMTDANHFLNIKVNDSTQSQIGRVFLDMNGLSVVSGTEVNDQTGTNATGIGMVTYQGTYQGATVTLVIDQGNSTSGVIITHA